MKNKLLLLALISTSIGYLLYAEIDTALVKGVFAYGTMISVPAAALLICIIKSLSEKQQYFAIAALSLLGILVMRFTIAYKSYLAQGVIMVVIAEVSLMSIAYIALNKR